MEAYSARFGELYRTLLNRWASRLAADHHADSAAAHAGG